MLAQAPNLPAALRRVATTPVLASERPAVRIDFSNSHTSESAGYALMRTHAAAVRFAHTAGTLATGGLFRTRALAIRRFTVAVTATTSAKATILLALALAHLRRSER